MFNRYYDTTMSFRGRREHGSALLNVALALVVGLSVIAGAWSVGSSALQESKVRKTIHIVEQVRDAIYNGYRGEVNYANLNMGNLYDQGFLDTSLFSSRGVLPSPSGNRIVASRRTRDENKCNNFGRLCHDAFQISITGLDKWSCMKLSQAHLGSRHWYTGFIDSSGSNAYYSQTPITASDSSTYCGGANDVAEIRYSFD